MVRGIITTVCTRGSVFKLQTAADHIDYWVFLLKLILSQSNPVLYSDQVQDNVWGKSYNLILFNRQTGNMMKVEVRVHPNLQNTRSIYIIKRYVKRKVQKPVKDVDALCIIFDFLVVKQSDLLNYI